MLDVLRTKYKPVAMDPRIYIRLDRPRDGEVARGR
jgi:hypothetical protein